MRTKIRCGCGLLCTESLDEYSVHLQEHAAKETEQGLKRIIRTTSVESIYTEEEIERQNQERQLFR